MWVRFSLDDRGRSYIAPGVVSLIIIINMAVINYSGRGCYQNYFTPLEAFALRYCMNALIASFIGL